MTPPVHRTARSYLTPLVTVSIITGILYCWWPLGYWLNPVAAKVSLASGFEAVGQPYNWVFIGIDIMSSLFALLLCRMLWRRFVNNKSAAFVAAAIVSVALFAIFGILDAVLSEHCVPNLQHCASFTQDHSLLVHGVFSILGSLALFASLVILWLQQRRNLLLNTILVGYILFGLISLVEAVTPGKSGNWSQHYYITLCSVWLVLIPYAIRQVAAERNAVDRAASLSPAELYAGSVS